jgi:hypothetical protein
MQGLKPDVLSIIYGTTKSRALIQNGVFPQAVWVDGTELCHRALLRSYGIAGSVHLMMGESAIEVRPSRKQRNMSAR